MLYFDVHLFVLAAPFSKPRLTSLASGEDEVLVASTSIHEDIKPKKLDRKLVSMVH